MQIQHVITYYIHAYYYSLYLIARKWFLLLWGHLIYFRGPWKVGRKRLKFSHQGKSLHLYSFQVLPAIVWCTKSHKFSGLKRNGRCIVFALDTVTLSSIFCNYKECNVEWFIWMYMKPYSHPSMLFSVLLFDTVNAIYVVPLFIPIPNDRENELGY